MSGSGLIVSAVRSGEGKTTVAIALLAALARRGMVVRAAKSGPDYIDGAYHAAACRAPSVNLDSFAMAPPLIDTLAAEAAGAADLLVVEGALGLFDGVGGATAGRSGATADLALRFGLPVVIVLDISGQSQTAAAVLRGLASHDLRVAIAGVILNRVGSERHRRLVSDAIDAIGMPILGAIPRDAAFALPERHLGLVQAAEHDDLERRLAALADMAERHLDLDRLIAAASPLVVAAPPSAPVRRLPPPGSRIALASDAAFSFIYPHVTAGWRAASAEIVPFSPLADEAPPEDCDACWLPGGYPELHAGRIAAARKFRAGLARFAETRPVHGECGGYMVLGTELIDAEGVSHHMTGLLGHATSFATRRLHLGYRSARLLADGVLGAKDGEITGHEFHYSIVLHPGADDGFSQLRDAQGNELGTAGGVRGLVSGSYFHAIAPA